MPTQSERTDAARAAIIAAAIDVLGSEGHRALTNARIQEVSGHSRGLVNYHFGSRQGLLEAAVGRIRDDFLTDLVDSPAAASRTGLDAAVELVDTYLRELVRDPRRNLATLVLTVASIGELPALRECVRDLNSRLRDGINRLLARGVQDGSVHPGTDTATAAALIVSLLRGTTIQWLADPEGFDIDTARHELGTVITRTYGRHPGRPAE